MPRFFLLFILLAILGSQPLQAQTDKTSAAPAPIVNVNENLSPTEPTSTASKPPPTDEIDFTWMFAKTLISMVVVLTLAVISLKYILPKWTSGRPFARGSQGLQLQGRLALDSKKGLVIVQVDDRRFLLGVSDHQVNLISELGNSPEPEEI